MKSCPKCGGVGRIVVDDGWLGKETPCPACHTWLAHSRLTPSEQTSKLSDITGGGQMATLRGVGKAILADRFGWFTVWGGTGSAKTLFLQALVVGFCEAGVQAVYYHAADLRNGLLRDIDNPDSDNAAYYRRVPVLVIDELDKYHMTDWSRGQLQALLDERYRNMQTHITLFATNKDPLDDWLPEDIQSRLQDGRFNRRLGTQEIPAIFHIKSPDMRPSLRRAKPVDVESEAQRWATT